MLFLYRMQKILFLTTAHTYQDDRIFFHQAKELAAYGFTVKICSLSSEFQGESDGILIESYDILHQSPHVKKSVFQRICAAFVPDLVIASEPLAVISVAKYCKQHHIKLIYDVTEWYPSKRMLAPYRSFLKVFQFFKFLNIQLYAGFLSSHFIFGEQTKMFPLSSFFFFKSHIILPYYPSRKYVRPAINELNEKKLTLCYTGVFSKEKGIGNFLKAADCLQKEKPELQLSLLLIGGTRDEKETEYFNQLLTGYQFDHVKIQKPVSFSTFADSYAEADICFDLREKNIENDHCLPIKLFYYAASGKPVIYTDLKAIRQHLDVEQFGYLVPPEDAWLIAHKVAAYLDDPALYAKHANNARRLFQEKYNWESISDGFVKFIKNALP